MIKAMIAAVSLAMAQQAAASETVYVDCPFKAGDGSDWPVQFTLNEGQGSAVVLLKATGRAFTYRASFGPDAVQFGDRWASYRLDRITLKVVREPAQDSGPREVQCALRKAPARAF